jgi:MSHA pilin protein MshA
LIELVIVIVILGILAAVALPQFANLSDDANKAKAEGIAGAVNSAFATAKAACQGSLATCTPAVKTIVDTPDCTTALGLLEGTVTLPTGYDFAGTPPNCTITTP